MGSFSGLPIELGAGKEVRTPDLYLGKVSLYQLSYSRITGRQFNKQSKRKHYSLQKGIKQGKTMACQSYLSGA
jgi:hypothetical protein